MRNDKARANFEFYSESLVGRYINKNERAMSNLINGRNLYEILIPRIQGQLPRVLLTDD